MDDDQRDSGQRRRSAVDTANNVFTAVSRVRKGAQVAGLIGANIWVVVGIIVGITLLTFILTLTGGSASGIPEGGSEQAASPTLAAPGGGVISGSGRACTVPFEGKGKCSVDNLKPYFGGDEKKAIIASLICQAESSSNPYAINPTCPDYSVGLFQINLIAHCPGAYSAPYSACKVAGQVGEGKRDVCQKTWWVPEENIRYSASSALSNGGTVWTPWTTLTTPKPGRPSVKNILTGCGISL
ncbi:MAG: hypothetical protein WD992_01950 [Candidatus Levyibacteriota bacterium]